MLKFEEKNHTYVSVVPDNRKWTSITKIISSFKVPFDDNIAFKNSTDPYSKYYGLTPDAIKQIWENERNRSTKLGSSFHKMMEEKAFATGGLSLAVNKGDWKFAGNQELTKVGVYPEHFAYNSYYAICGQADIVETTDYNTLNIGDFKTSKKIDRTGYKGKKMLKPINHLDDCYFNHYALQLSFYMWMILQHNPQLRPGLQTIYHIKFVKAGEDKYGFPIYHKDNKGGNIVEDITPIVVPYMEYEVKLILDTFKTVYPAQ